jgi:hypothetical protein
VNWISLPQEKDNWPSPVKTAINFPLPQNKGALLNGLTIVSFSIKTILEVS